MGKNHIQINLWEKLLVVLFCTGVIAFVSAHVFWTRHARSLLQKEKSSQLTDALKYASDTVANNIAQSLSKLNSYSLGLSDADDIELINDRLMLYLMEDASILSLTLASPRGQEIAKVSKGRSYAAYELGEVGFMEEFKAVAFLHEKKAIGPVIFEDTQIPYIHIAVPYYKSYSDLIPPEQMPHADYADLAGVLIGKISLEPVISAVSSYQIGREGYIMLVEQSGTVFAHPQAQYIGTSATTAPQSEIAVFLTHPHIVTSHQSPPPVKIKKSLRDEKVLAAHQKIENTGWGIIAEYPLKNIDAGILPLQSRSIGLLLIPLIFIAAATVYMGQTVIPPIRMVSASLARLAQGEYPYPLEPASTAELGSLVATYNTAAKNLEATSKKSAAEKNTLSTILENSEYSIIGLDIYKRIRYANKATFALLHALPAELYGTTFDDVIVLYADSSRMAFTDLLTITQQSPLKLFRRSGAQAFVRVTVSPAAAATVTDIRYIVTIADLTKQQQEDSMKLDFVSIAAHELRTPLTAIRGYTQLIEHTISQTADAETKEFITRLGISCDNLANLVDNLLNVTRIERNTLKLEKMPLDMVELIRGVMQDLHQQAQIKSQTLTFIEPQTVIPKIYADKFRVVQVLTNLIANAINYTPQSGSVTVSARVKDDYVEVSIADTGIGIPKESLPKLFTKFYRVSGALEVGSKGTGLGLYISKTIVNMHKGTITVESERGKGTTFRFTIPIATGKEIQAFNNNKNLGPSMAGMQHKGLVLNKDRFIDTSHGS